jgi:hypothetical protein
MSAEKHINYFALEKACEKPGCPLCTIVSERSARYIDNMLFEHVSDRGFRAKFREAGGFCPIHAKNLDSYRDGLAVAILGGDILADVLPSLKKQKISKPKARCPACEETARIETEFLGFVAESSDEHFTAFFTSSDGLCVPHYRHMISNVKRIPSWLSSFQEAKFTALLERTRVYIECSAWGRQDDFARLSARDKIVWKEIALTLRGNKE